MPEEDLLQQRRAKLDRLRARGIDPYPPRYRRTHSAAEAAALFAQHEAGGRPPDDLAVSVAGRITASRGMGKLTFLDLRDGSGRIQASFQRDTLGPDRYALLKELDLGDFLGVEGTLFRTKTGEVTVQARDFAVLAKSVRPLPEKWHGLKDVEQRYRQRYLDLIANEEVRRVFLLRSRVLSAVRRFLEARGFVEVETPILQPVAAGAMATPFVTRHRALDRTLYLRIATELHLKRLLVGGFDKVFEIGRIFRNEGIDLKHNPEFTTLESYEAYADYNDVMRMVEEMFAAVAQETLGATRITYAGQEIDLTPPWRRLSLVDAIRERSGIDILDAQFRPDPVGTDSLRREMRARGLTPKDGTSWPQLVDKLIGDAVEPTLLQPTFLLDYPRETSPLAKSKPGPDASGLVERFEAFVAGMEVANAFTELNDPLEQRKRMDAQEEARKLYAQEEFDRLDEDFLVAVEHGMPPAGGLGVGIDRLVMLLADKQSIREVILFPQLRTVE